MNRLTRFWVITSSSLAVLLVAVVGSGRGQLGLGGPGEGIKLGLLRSPAVQKELDLTEKQKQQVAKLGDDAKAAKKQFDQVSKGQEKAGGEAILKGTPNPAREAALAELESGAEASLRKVLEPKQRTRLAEIALQAEGAQAFVKPEIIQALGLSDDQVDEIRGVLGTVRERQDQAKAIQKRTTELGNFALEKVAKEQQKVQSRAVALKVSRRAMAEVGKIISKAQKEKYRRMCGEPFDFNEMTDAEGRKLFDDSTGMASALLKMAAIRAELKLTPEQGAALDREEPAAKVLKPDQKTRLTQIGLQSEGASAFTRPEVIRSLKLDDEQVAQIGEILDGLGDDRRNLREARKRADEARKAEGAPALDPVADKVRKDQEKEQIQVEADRLGGGVMPKIAAVMTKAQRDAFRKQLGAPFDFGNLRGPGGARITGEAPASPK